MYLILRLKIHFPNFYQWTTTNFTLKPKGTEKYTVTITVDEQANNDFNINNKKSADLDKFTSDFLEETLSIKAVQTNADNATLVD